MGPGSVNLYLEEELVSKLDICHPVIKRTTFTNHMFRDVYVPMSICCISSCGFLKSIMPLLHSAYHEYLLLTVNNSIIL